MSGDAFDLERFVAAQAPIYDQVVRELRTGRKISHWMWYLFPQLEGLGQSPMAHKYAIRSLEEARAYLVHAILGPHLRECTSLVNSLHDRWLHEIFGSPDDMKFHSCMTLFSRAALDNDVFTKALQQYAGGEEDEATLRLLKV